MTWKYLYVPWKKPVATGLRFLKTKSRVSSWRWLNYNTNWIPNLPSNSLILLCFTSSWNSWLDRIVEWSFENSNTVLASWKYLAWMGQGPQEGYICSKSRYNIWCYFSHFQDSLESRNHGVITITLTDPLEKFVLLILVTIYSFGLCVLDPKGWMFPLRDITMNFIKLKFDCHLYTWSLSCLWINWQRKELLCWMGWLTLITKGNLECYYTTEVRKNMSGTQDIP